MVSVHHGDEGRQVENSQFMAVGACGRDCSQYGGPGSREQDKEGAGIMCSQTPPSSSLVSPSKGLTSSQNRANIWGALWQPWAYGIQLIFKPIIWDITVHLYWQNWASEMPHRWPRSCTEQAVSGSDPKFMFVPRDCHSPLTEIPTLSGCLMEDEAWVSQACQFSYSCIGAECKLGKSLTGCVHTVLM